MKLMMWSLLVPGFSYAGLRNPFVFSVPDVAVSGPHGFFLKGWLAWDRKRTTSFSLGRESNRGGGVM